MAGAGVSALAPVALSVGAGVRMWSPKPRPAPRTEEQKRTTERGWNPFTNSVSGRNPNFIEYDPRGIWKSSICDIYLQDQIILTHPYWPIQSVMRRCGHTVMKPFYANDYSAYPLDLLTGHTY